MKKQNFKIGDRVLIIDQTYRDYLFGSYVGKKGRIIDVAHDYYYQVQFDIYNINEYAVKFFTPNQLSKL